MALAVRRKRNDISIAVLKKKLWKLVSIYVRSKEADFAGNVRCFTCDRVDHWRTFDAGHYIPKSVGGSRLYFNELNIHPQCTGCNRFRHGNLSQYALRLQRKYGPTILEELDKLRGTEPFKRAELEELITVYARKIKNLT